MKTIRKIVFEDVIPETDTEKLELEKIIKEVETEKIDISKLKLIKPGDYEEDTFRGL